MELFLVVNHISKYYVKKILNYSFAQRYTVKCSYEFLLFKESDYMPNYEELYYTARSNYYRAVENRNQINRRTEELTGRKNSLTQALQRDMARLRDLQHKLSLVQDAERKCVEVTNNHFPPVKSGIQSISEEFRKILASDRGVADINAIYASDLQATQSDLGVVASDLARVRRMIEEELNGVQGSVNNTSNELNAVSSQLRNVGDSRVEQIRANNYYAQMREYQRRWQNGE